MCITHEKFSKAGPTVRGHRVWRGRGTGKVYETGWAPQTFTRPHCLGSGVGEGTLSVKM